MQVKSYLSHKNLFLFGLVLLAAGIPVSRFLCSVAQILLLGNWLIERDFLTKWNKLRRSGVFWSFLGIYLFYAAGLLWSGDYTYALKDLRIKLPMLWLPVLFFTAPKLSRKEYHVILHFFVAAVVAASLCSMAVYLGFTKKQVHDVRDISIFESHIRFSLMIVLAILYLFFTMIRKDISRSKWPYVLVLLWLLFFLFLLQSFTGIIIAAIIAVSALSWILVSKKPLLVKLAFLTGVVGAGGYLIYLFADEWKKFKIVNTVDYKTLPPRSINGNSYWHDTAFKQTENGNQIWLYICEPEMRREWNKRHWRKFDSLDFRGNKLSFTLTRYLASRGYTRDSTGIWQLTDQDIKNVDEGCSNYRYCNTSGIRTRIHELIWEINQAMLKQNPTGHSLAMRYEFWKTAWHIIKAHPVAGVGTGDVEKTFKEQYKIDKSTLPVKWQLRSHNQFLAVAVALGFTGLLLFLLSFYTPFLFTKRHSWFFIFFMLIQFLSFFNEDTLETQAGVTFCVFFTQLLFHNEEYNL